MPTPVVPVTLRRAGVAVGVLIALVVLLLSHTFGRAVPTNNYRPLITTDALASGCYPLPGGATLAGLSYQVRWDEDVETPEGERRLLRGQFNLVDREGAVRLLAEAFRRVGFRDADLAGIVTDDPDAAVRVLHHPETGEEVAITVKELPDTSAKTLVRGEFTLALPVAQLAKDDPICRFPSSTKRWADAE